jgi:hypothetical protein
MQSIRALQTSSAPRGALCIAIEELLLIFYFLVGCYIYYNQLRSLNVRAHSAVGRERTRFLDATVGRAGSRAF